MLGVLANLIEVMPIAVLAPVLMFVALDITVQAFPRGAGAPRSGGGLQLLALDRAPA